MNVTTIELLDILAGIARHPDTSPENRASNTAELQRLLKHHGLTEADLTPPGAPEGAPEWRGFSPGPATQAERLLAVHLTCAVRKLTAIHCLGETGTLEVQATPEQWREIESLWTRHLPVFRRCWEQSAAGQEELMRREIGKIHREREELQRRQDRLGRELECVEDTLAELPGHALWAFILTWDLPVGEREDPADPWSDGEPVPEWLVPASVIARAMIRDSGEPPADAPDTSAD